MNKHKTNIENLVGYIFNIFPSNPYPFFAPGNDFYSHLISISSICFFEEFFHTFFLKSERSGLQAIVSQQPCEGQGKDKEVVGPF